MAAYFVKIIKKCEKSLQSSVYTCEISNVGIKKSFARIM